MAEAAMSNEKLRYSYNDPNMIFGNLEEEEDISRINRVSIDEEDDDEKNSNGDERRAFWESQRSFFMSTSFEAKVGQATKDALTELDSSRLSLLLSENGGRCRSLPGMQTERSVRSASKRWIQLYCLHIQVQNFAGNSNRATHLSRSNADNSVQKTETKVIIELNFRAEFEMARSSQEYKQLITKLPQVFVGTIERLRNLVKILCAASKKSMNEEKMYMAPWRKHRYMQAKWQGTPLPPAAPSSVAAERPTPPPKQRASLLTFEFVDILHQNKAVEVI